MAYRKSLIVRANASVNLLWYTSQFISRRRKRRFLWHFLPTVETRLPLLASGNLTKMCGRYRNAFNYICDIEWQLIWYLYPLCKNMAKKKIFSWQTIQNNYKQLGEKERERIQIDSPLHLSKDQPQSSRVVNKVRNDLRKASWKDRERKFLATDTYSGRKRAIL